MASSFIDSLKLVLSDSYEISDSDYKTLSDILLNKGLSDDALDSGLVQIVYLMVKNNVRFPISMAYLKELWETENVSYNFVGMISGILKSGVISLRKISKDVFFKSDNISKVDNEDDQDLYIVVYGSPVFNEILDGFSSVLNKSSAVSEGVVFNAPKKVSDIVTKASKHLKSLGVTIDVESYTNDSALGIARLNVLLNSVSNYMCGDKVIQRIAKKYIKGNAVKDIEAYKEDESSLFLGIDIVLGANLAGIADGIYNFIEELEVEGV